jgi:hypothetical protein
MKDPAQQWLMALAAPAGMLACGLRRPDGKFLCRSAGESCPAAKMERILGSFAGLRASLFSAQIAPRWSTWAFAQGQIRFVERADGWLLGLVVNAGPGSQSALDAFCQEFLSLRFGS